MRKRELPYQPSGQYSNQLDCDAEIRFRRIDSMAHGDKINVISDARVCRVMCQTQRVNWYSLVRTRSKASGGNRLDTYISAELITPNSSMTTRLTASLATPPTSFLISLLLPPPSQSHYSSHLSFHYSSHLLPRLTTSPTSFLVSLLLPPPSSSHYSSHLLPHLTTPPTSVLVSLLLPPLISLLLPPPSQSHYFSHLSPRLTTPPNSLLI